MKKILIVMVRGYQAILSPFFPQSCRFYPSCSEYAIAALEKHGALKGTILMIKRILKCHPFHRGGIDNP